MTLFSKHIEEINTREGKEIFNQGGWQREECTDCKLREIYKADFDQFMRWVTR